ncbi:MAG: hypothetical protein FJ088_04910, partial [Deltaproteobacteria bacterium]|nr:hypothetical protein [Deltaproteobacteria bacterium]
AAAQFGGFMAMLSLKEGSGKHLKSFFAGLLISFSVVLEYPALFAAAALTLYFMLSRRDVRSWALYFAGALIPAALLSFFHYEAFGAIYRTPYATLENPGYVQDIAPGFMGLREPKLENLYGSFFSPYMGLFFFSPWLLFIFPAIILLIWKWKNFRANGQGWSAGNELLVSIVICFIYAAFIACHSLWRGGWTVGPRYIAGIVPFAMFAAALFVSRLERNGYKHYRIVLFSLIAVSLIITPLASIIIQGFPPEYLNPFAEMAVPMLSRGFARPNAGNLIGLYGVYSLIPFLSILLFLILYIAFSPTDWKNRLLKGFVTLAIASALIAGVMHIKSPDTKGVEEATKFLKSVW